MNKIRRTAAPLALLALLGLTACTSAADKAGANLSKAADNFEVPRRIVGINGITDKILFEVVGFCSYSKDGATFDATCKQPDGSITRTTLLMSDNVTVVVTQIGEANVGLFKSRVIRRPETLIPNFDLSTSAGG